MNHTQVAILTSAQKQQMADRDQVMDSLRLEMEEAKGENTGMSQMVDQITSLSNEKR